MVPSVRDNHIASRIQRQRGGQVEPGRRCRASIATESRRARACNRRNQPARGSDLAHTLVVAVGDEQIARCVHRESGGRVEFRGGGRAVVAGKALHSVARDRGDDSGRRDLANDVVAGLGESRDCPVRRRRQPRKHQRQRRGLGLSPRRNCQTNRYASRQAQPHALPRKIAAPLSKETCCCAHWLVLLCFPISLRSEFVPMLALAASANHAISPRSEG